MTTSSVPMSDSIQGAVNTFSRLLSDTTRLSLDMLSTWSDLLQSSLRTAPSQLTESARGMMSSLQNAGSASTGRMGCCRIPPPCWLPQPIGDVTSHVCPGATAVVRVCVSNCSFAPRTITVEAPANSGISVTPGSLNLGPKEKGCFTISFPVDANKSDCGEWTHYILVRGCRLHYLLWTVTVDKRGGCTCHEVDVEDCPDYIHHWYDHFYCYRPCLPAPGTRVGGADHQ